MYNDITPICILYITTTSCPLALALSLGSLPSYSKQYLGEGLGITILSYFSVPGQVMSVVATATSSSEVRVQWEGSAADDGVEGYVVQYEPATSVICEGVKGGEVRVEGEGVRERVITGLEEGVDYGIRAAAYNSIGDGEPSDPPAEVYTLEEGMFLFCISN